MYVQAGKIRSRERCCSEGGKQNRDAFCLDELVGTRRERGGDLKGLGWKIEERGVI